MEEPPVFIGLDNPVEVRRALLESLKANIHCLQRSESLKEIRSQKHAEAAKFKEVTSELHEMIAELKKNLPKVRIRKHAEPKRAAKAPVHHEHASELDKLEGELAAIESKLSSLQ